MEHEVMVNYSSKTGSDINKVNAQIAAQLYTRLYQINYTEEQVKGGVKFPWRQPFRILTEGFNFQENAKNIKSILTDRFNYLFSIPICKVDSQTSAIMSTYVNMIWYMNHCYNYPDAAKMDSIIKSQCNKNNLPIEVCQEEFAQGGRFCKNTN
jgi:hypothetical protein